MQRLKAISLSLPTDVFGFSIFRKMRILLVWSLFWLLISPCLLAKQGRPTMVHFGLLPYSTKSSGYPQAFGGGSIGVSLGAAYYFMGRSGIAIGFISAGTASVGLASYRMFLLGEPQRHRQDLEELPEDRDKNPIIMNRKQWGLFAEAGAGYYKVTKLEFSSGSFTQAGGILFAAAGGNYPILKDFSAFFRLGILNTASSNSLSAIFGELAISYAFNM